MAEDKSFVESLKKEKSDFVKQANTLQNPASRFEYLTFKCREYARNYSIRVAKMRKSRRIFLERKVAELEILIASNSDDQVHKEYNQYKIELETLYNYITAGLILRSKISWYEHGEKSSKYFLNLEKRNKVKSHLRKIITDSNIEISDPSEIMCHVQYLCSALYERHSTKNEKECLEHLNGLSLPKLKDSEREVCEGLITRKECWDALNATKNSKSPGNDGLTKEFYVCFFNEICSRLIDTLNYSSEVGQLSTSQCQALITIIEKKIRIKDTLKIGGLFLSLTSMPK